MVNTLIKLNIPNRIIGLSFIVVFILLTSLNNVPVIKTKKIYEDKKHLGLKGVTKKRGADTRANEHI